MSLGTLNDCKYLESLTEEEINELIVTDKIIPEQIIQTYDRVFVFLYLKHKKSPLLTDANIKSAYSKPNDTRFPTKLNDAQFNELRNKILEVYNKNKDYKSLSLKLFNTESSIINKEIEIWERRNKVVYYGSKCIIGNKAGGDLNRTIAFIKLNDNERQNVIDRDSYGCSTITKNNSGIKTNYECVFITNNKETIMDDSLWIVISNTKSAFTANLKDLFKIRIIKEAFSEGLMIGINPRLGFILQSKYPDIWETHYMLPETDDINRITLLTLQADKFIKSADDIVNYYKSDIKKDELIKFDPAKMDELIENQKWASKGTVRYKNILDLKTLNFNAPVFDLIFVRHGYSCANKMKASKYKLQWTYSDPELTKDALETSKKAGLELIKRINSIWPGKDYSLGSSQMIRTQETAYYMLAKATNKKINIIPHVAEFGMGADNFSLPLEKQREIINSRNPDVLKFINKDAREKQTSAEKSNWNMFMAWALNHLDFFTKGDDGYYRAVIFTHGIFLRNNFKLKDKMVNNNGIHTIINTATSLKPNADYKLLLLNTQKNVDSCPDNCIRSMCSKTRKNYKSIPKMTTGKNCNTCSSLRRIKRSRKLIGAPPFNNPGTYTKHPLNLIF